MLRLVMQFFNGSLSHIIDGVMKTPLCAVKFFCYIACIILMAPLGACTTTTPVTSANESANPAPPVCWFYQPVHGNLIGSVGIARNMAIGGPKRVNQLAKQRAAMGLSAYLGIEELDEKKLDSLIKPGTRELALNGQQIRFVDHVDWQGYRYQYAVLNAPPGSIDALRNDCNKSCLPTQCEPSWLCNPMEQNKAGLIGISFRATTLPNQYRIAVQNAIDQLHFLYGVKVQTQGWYYQAKDSLGSYRVRVQDVQVEPSQTSSPKDLRFVVSNSCFSGEQLFVRVLSSDLPPIQHGVSARQWIINPSQSGHQGVVGTASLTSDGLISSQIKLAIRRAFGGLSGSQNTHIQDTSLVRQYNKAATFVRELQAKGEPEMLSGRVQGIYFEPQDSYRTRIYVWVVKSENPLE